MTEKRVCFDFEIEFSNGGGIQGQGFRLDIDGSDIADQALAATIVRDLRLLMVGEVRILNKRIVDEQHKRGELEGTVVRQTTGTRFVDLSHVIESGMVTYKGLPAPLVCDHLSRIQSRHMYAPGTEFQIGRIEMVGNTGTYIDTPYHRYADGYDLTGLSLEQISDVPGLVVRVVGMKGRSIDWANFAAVEVRGRAVFVHTGWDAHWRTDGYFEGHPFLTKAAAEYLRDQGASLVGIDSMNIDDTSDGARPVHTTLLAAGIPIVEHLTNLAALPVDGFRFSAVPPKIAAMGTFPVRAHARLDV
ncbi:cyclase family protein [Dyella tabacisoli]|uniref:Cyclase family protein n=1 Tax=Dyella tabacisoli TaxID=2282381 RepID=A0A369URT0_9GAMM|nr:cyclase family protein [Dyella tabacisoli]RDD82745.1 cyclase family protein [Dyella tabacisoli]